MLVISLLLHVVLIAFIPGLGIFLPSGDIPYIEIEAILFNPETEEDLETESDSEAEENAQGEFVVQPNLSVSEPDKIERPDMLSEWERIVLERESLPPEIPKIEDVPDKLPSIDPKALTVQVELRHNVSNPSLERPGKFERPESVTADDVTKNAEQPFDMTALHGEEPIPEAGPEFRPRELPELSENQALSPPLTLAKASRTISTSPVAVPPVRAFQQQDEPATDMPELQLPERPERAEVEDESLSLAGEELRIIRETAVLPDSNELSDFQTRPLPEIVKSGALTVIPERRVAALRPAIAAEPLPLQRDFQPKTVKKEYVESLPRSAPPFSERDDSLAEVEMPQAPPKQEEHIVSPQDDEEPAFPFSSADLAKTPKVIVRSAEPLRAVRVSSERDTRTLINIPMQAALSEVEKPLEQGEAFERPLVLPERPERIEIEDAPELHRLTPKVEPSPTPLFTVRRPAAHPEEASSPGAKPLPRFFSDPTRVQRERSPVMLESGLLNRTFGTRRAGLLPVEAEALPLIEGEKAVIEQDDTLEEARADELQKEAVEFPIEGPASGRDVVYKPLQLPEVAIDMEVDIRLKFWVLPDGSVGEVVPLQRGDVRLERAAIQYLKSWRFTPVSDGREVWGIIPIRYKLR